MLQQVVHGLVGGGLTRGVTGVAGGGGGAAYDPGMMTFDGSSWYSKGSITQSSNAETIVFRYNSASFTGGSTRYICVVNGITPAPKWRMSALLFPSDHATAIFRNKLSILCYDASGTIICRLFSTVDAVGIGDAVGFASYDATAGTALFYLNGSDVQDTGHANHTLTTGTMQTGSSAEFIVGGSELTAGGNMFVGDIGYIGERPVYLTNPTDFYHPTNGLQEIDETTWTEWGAQPLFWNQYGQMTDNKGSAGPMAKIGTVTPPEPIIEVYDTFTDSDSTALASHTPDIGNTWSEPTGSWTIAGNKANSSTTQLQVDRAVIDSGKSDLNVSVDFTMGDGPSASGGPMLRYNSSTSYWIALLLDSVDELRIYEVNSGNTQRASTAVTISAGNTYKVNFGAYGTALNATVTGGAGTASYTSSFNQTQTNVGIYSNFQIGTINSAHLVDEFISE